MKHKELLAQSRLTVPRLNKSWPRSRSNAMLGLLSLLGSPRRWAVSSSHPFLSFIPTLTVCRHINLLDDTFPLFRVLCSLQDNSCPHHRQGLSKKSRDRAHFGRMGDSGPSDSDQSPHCPFEYLGFRGPQSRHLGLSAFVARYPCSVHHYRVRPDSPGS